MSGRIPIEAVWPVVDCGRHPAKAVVGEHLPIAATVYREGHDAVGCGVAWRGPDGARRPVVRLSPGEPGTDRWYGEIAPDAPGLWKFTIEAWSDPYLTWKNAVEKKIAAGQGVDDLRNELELGARCLATAAERAPRSERAALLDAVRALRNDREDLAHRVAPALGLGEVMWRHPVRELVTRSPTYQVWVDRTRALYGAWYEFFPRSEGATLDPLTRRGPTSGTLHTAMKRLPAIAAMGFDVIYLPPIHPIGTTHRKGPNNTLDAGPYDPGSPWAIGSPHGGHDTIHPDLGTQADFDAFVAHAADHGLEIALDLALQCSPDHPWVTQHPEWFTTRPDGTIAHAENPPKKYQDIYPLNFDHDPNGLYNAVKTVVHHWMNHGVRIFRVDNPHTNPIAFWERLLADINTTDPDVLFLAEA
ncbi:MAG: maltotransferase domain-containing protein, partial [Stackebrandtia sp.]